MTRDELLCVNDAKTRIGCSRKTLYRWMKDGRLPFEQDQDGRRWIRKEIVERLAVEFRTKPRSDACTSDRLAEKIEQLRRELSEQRALLVDIIALYHPASTADLGQKRRLLEKYQPS